MKSILSAALCLLLCGALTACAAADPEKPDTSTIPVPASEQTEQAPQILEEQVVYDADGIRITVKGMEETTVTGTNVRILVENGTDRNLALSGELFLVNGVTVPGYLYAQTAAGTKTNDAIEFYKDVLDAAGIRKIGQIRGYDTRILDTDTYEILARVPLDLTTAHGPDTGYVPDESGVELYRQKGITVIGQSISPDFYGRTVQLLVKNNTGKDMIAEAEHVSVNGYTVDAWLYDTVAADSVRFCQLDLFETSLAENGIDQIEHVSFQLNFLDGVSYETIAQSGVLTVEVKG